MAHKAMSNIPVLLIRADQNGTAPDDKAEEGARKVRVPVGDGVNAELGANHYLLKRKNGKRTYYRPDEWAVMSPEQRKAARDFTKAPTGKDEAIAKDLVQAFVSADPLAQKALVDTLAPMIEARIREAMATEKAAGEKKAGGK